LSPLTGIWPNSSKGSFRARNDFAAFAIHLGILGAKANPPEISIFQRLINSDNQYEDYHTCWLNAPGLPFIESFISRQSDLHRVIEYFEWRQMGNTNDLSRYDNETNRASIGISSSLAILWQGMILWLWTIWEILVNTRRRWPSRSLELDIEKGSLSINNRAHCPSPPRTGFENASPRPALPTPGIVRNSLPSPIPHANAQNLLKQACDNPQFPIHGQDPRTIILSTRWSPMLNTIWVSPPSKLDTVHLSHLSKVQGIIRQINQSQPALLIWNLQWSPPDLGSGMTAEQIANIFDIAMSAPFTIIPFSEFLWFRLGHPSVVVQELLDGISDLRHKLCRFFDKQPHTKKVYERVEEVMSIVTR
jgi:hypothetical protein